MTLTKSHLIDKVAGQFGFTRKKSTETVKTFLEIIKSTLASGQNFMINTFGKLYVKEKRGRSG